ncbi:DedA family protein [Thermomonospora amylolytica]|uniref:DedA family protein n=1 Tax=Thermomonospora amylolytica TaxID=1411117 RepID=UPI000E6C5EA6|nr:DedA family protein [Thermomonospora amylolytica]
MIAGGGQGQQELNGIAGWAADVIDALGAVGVGLLIALENIFPPLPSEVVLPLAGFTASEGKVNVVAVIAGATAGSLLGALVLYGLGAWLGHERACRLADRLPFVDTAELDRATAWFADHGGKTVLFGRVVPVVRSLVSVPAGIERMPLTRFCLYTAIGSGAWNTLFVLLGYVLGERWTQAEKFANWATYAVLALAVLWTVKFVVGRMRARARSSA